MRADADALLRRLSRDIDDAMLVEMAAADYGWAADLNLLHLRHVRDEGVLPVPLELEPREVLELIRWSEPDQFGWRPGGVGTRGHRMRAFACAALLRSAGEPTNAGRNQGDEATLIQLIDSHTRLGGSFEVEAAALMAWLIGRCTHTPYEDDLSLFGVGLLWFTLGLPRPLDITAIVELCQWIVATGRAASGRLGERPAGDGWLLRWWGSGQRDASWRRLGEALAALDLGPRSDEARRWVGHVGTGLGGG